MVLSPGQIEQVPRGLPSLSPAYPALAAPPIPDPFPGGKGETKDYFMQGASPLASPGLNPRGTGSTCRCRRLNGGVPQRCWLGER